MTKKIFLCLFLFSLPFPEGSKGAAAQEGASRIHVNVILVQLSVAVTDRKGNYVSGLHPEDFAILEDGIQKRRQRLRKGTSRRGRGSTSRHPTIFLSRRSRQRRRARGLRGANVFILFDTSNYMYPGFVFAQDAIADFIRSLEGVNRVALYSYSRNLSRVSTLTPDRSQVLRGVRSTVAGDDAALYNSLLLTVKDAAPLTGRKAIVVFSNGPDNASLVPPEDVAELAQSTGTIIYMISTRQAQSEPISTAIFERMSKATGGQGVFLEGLEG